MTTYVTNHGELNVPRWFPRAYDGLPKRLREARAARGLTQSQVANAMGITKAQVSKYENGYVTPSVLNLAVLAVNYAVPIDVLVFGPEVRS